MWRATAARPCVVDLRRVAPRWAEFVERTQRPETVRKAMGWLRDMYAYDAAALVEAGAYTRPLISSI